MMHIIPKGKSSQQVPMIHPTVKKYLGKAPKGTQLEQSTSQQSSASLQTTSQSAKVNVKTEQGTEKIGTMSLEDLTGMVSFNDFPKFSDIIKTFWNHSETGFTTE